MKKFLFGFLAMPMLFGSDLEQDFRQSAFVYVSQIIPEAVLEIRYFSTYNFVGSRIDGYEAAKAIMSQEAANALKKAAAALKAKGYIIKIFDAYRPQRAVNHFVRWAADLNDTKMKEGFYPYIDKSRLFKDGYIAKKSAHSRGSAIDLTLIDAKTGKELDMGGSFDYFGELSHFDFKGISKEQKANRQILRKAMVKAGFKPLQNEWWHFTLKNEPYADTYFDFVVK